ncbi:MAG: TPM domain-containing protein [Thermoanaerobaculia bacterium]
MNRVGFVLLLLALFAVPAASALDCPPAPTRWYTDAAGLADSSQVAVLDQKLAAFEQETGHQFLIYSLPSIENDAIEDFTVRCAQRWGVGQKKFDNGLIIFVFLKEKKIRVEVGYGLEGAVTDAYSSRVIREVIAPYFQRGDWAGGLNAGAEALMQRIRGNEPNVKPLSPVVTDGSGGADTGSVVFMILVFVFIFFIVPSLMRRRGGAGGGCGGCFWPMMFLGGSGRTFGGGGFGGGGGGFGGFSGGGGGFGGGGATGGW